MLAAQINDSLFYTVLLIPSLKTLISLSFKILIHLAFEEMALPLYKIIKHQLYMVTNFREEKGSS